MPRAKAIPPRRIGVAVGARAAVPGHGSAARGAPVQHAFLARQTRSSRPELSRGDRVGRVRDPLGNVWWLQERVVDLEPDEIARRATETRFIEAMRYLRSAQIVQPNG